MPTRRANATWEGGLQGGKGKFQGESGAVDASYSFGSRFADGAGSNPEELLAAAHAACYSMALSVGLERAGHAPERVYTEAAVTVEQVEGGFGITSIRLKTRVRAPGVEAAAFAEIAEATKKACPVSKALAAVPVIELDAQLEG
jgi:osmotically inducible protein OsmC